MYRNITSVKMKQLDNEIFFSISDDDLPGAHLLAEAKFSLQKIMPQMQKKFQITLEKPNLKVSFQIYLIILSPESYTI